MESFFHLPSRDIKKLICRKWKKIKTMSSEVWQLVGETSTFTGYFRIVIKCGEELRKFLAGIERIMNCTKIVSIECHYFYPHLRCVILFIYSHHYINGWPILSSRERTSKPNSQDMSFLPFWAHCTRAKDNAQLCSTILTALSWGWI